MTSKRPTHNGRPIRILCTDSDPTATWWIVYEDAPDTDAHVPQQELDLPTGWSPTGYQVPG